MPKSGPKSGTTPASAKSQKSASPPSVYQLDRDTGVLRKHIFAVIVDNEPGVLARVIGLFSGRGYNIESLTVSVCSEDETTSRITIVTVGTEMIISQIRAQLSRLVPVHDVHDITTEGPHVTGELAMVKVKAKDHNRRESLRIADVFGAKVDDTTLDSFLFTLHDQQERVDSFIKLMRALGEVEVARSGVVAMRRGNDIINA